MRILPISIRVSFSVFLAEMFYFSDLSLPPPGWLDLQPRAVVSLKNAFLRADSFAATSISHHLLNWLFKMTSQLVQSHCAKDKSSALYEKIRQREWSLLPSVHVKALLPLISFLRVVATE